jgi:hypothetical protein
MEQIEVTEFDGGHERIALANGRTWSAEVFVCEPRGVHSLADDHAGNAAAAFVLLPSARGLAVLDARGRRHELRPGEPFDAARIDARELSAGAAPAVVLGLRYLPRECVVSASVRRFERRGAGRLVETLRAGGHALLVACHGALRVRLAGEDEPQDLLANEALHLAARRETDFDVSATSDGATALLALVAPG